MKTLYIITVPAIILLLVLSTSYNNKEIITLNQSYSPQEYLTKRECVAEFLARINFNSEKQLAEMQILTNKPNSTNKKEFENFKNGNEYKQINSIYLANYTEARGESNMKAIKSTLFLAEKMLDTCILEADFNRYSIVKSCIVGNFFCTYSSANTNSAYSYDMNSINELYDYRRLSVNPNNTEQKTSVTMSSNISSDSRIKSRRFIKHEKLDPKEYEILLKKNYVDLTTDERHKLLSHKFAEAIERAAGNKD